MAVISDSRVVEAAPGRVWSVVADVDRDPEYWDGLNSVRNIGKEGNVVERVVDVGFIGSTSTQRVELRPERAVVVTMSGGPLKGSRETRLTPLEAGRRTRVEISWSFEFSGVPSFARPFVRSRLERGTREALSRIAAEAELDPDAPTGPADGGRKRPG